MNFTEQPRFDSPAPGRSEDELDGLLTRFFRAELPNPWPACPEPPVQVLSSPLLHDRWALVRSRFALAASVGLIVAALWAVGGKFTGPDAASPSLGSGDAATNVKPYKPRKPIAPDQVPSKISLFQDEEDGTKIRIDFFDR
jgi:hypothetical protein